MKCEYTSFFKLAPASLLEAAETEVQAELDRTDGELFHYQPQTFRGYNLGWPRGDVQGLLQFFSDVGCVFSQYRLAYSLLPDNLEEWPLKSEYLAFYYALSATEIRLNLLHEDRVNGAFREFECSNEFVRYRFMMNTFIDRYAQSHSISADIIKHFRALSLGERSGMLLS
ncbi:hypothetical protein [uncultured Idiomarina sp.]|uniref:hypothetical protein n=1 Tax=uncultured Idiomarina sp. TaxID=352961 RepID=UPI002591C666|nr:hypothetical protein [uncultured Idiomarina sp.]